MQLIVQTMKDDRVVPPDYIQLLQKCTSAYSVSQRAHPQQEKVGQISNLIRSDTPDQSFLGWGIFLVFVEYFTCTLTDIADCDHDLITILFKMALRGIFGFVLYATLTEISAYVYYFIHDF